MYAIFVTICAFVILLGYEIRHRGVAEELDKLKTLTGLLDEAVEKLKAEIKLKKNVYEDGPAPPK
jgi:hypothetical protein